MKTLSLEQEFIRLYPKRVAVLRYMREAIGVEEVSWEDINDRNMDKVRKLITERLSGNTPQVYCAIIKAFLRLNADMLSQPTAPTAPLRTKSMPSQNVFLTENEIRLIEIYAEALDMREGCEAEKDTLNAFLVECFCGARGIDVASFTEENIIDDHLVYISKKTKVMSRVPIHPKIRERLLRKPSAQHDMSVMNRIIKRVAKKCGINTPVTIFYRGKMQTQPKWKFLGFHSARRSFCSNLAQRGVDIYTIAALAGHRNANMTFRYIISDTDKLPTEAQSFFSGK